MCGTVFITAAYGASNPKKYNFMTSANTTWLPIKMPLMMTEDAGAFSLTIGYKFTISKLAEVPIAYATTNQSVALDGVMHRNCSHEQAHE
jgi:hypothetical protein